MLFYLVKAEHTYTMEKYATAWGSEPGERLRLLPYEELAGVESLETGTYIFSDLERLSPQELEMAGAVWRQLARAGPSVRLLNDPTRVLRRYDLLRTLSDCGRNRFRAIRASDSAAGLRFPVFVRHEKEHEGSLTPLLHTHDQLYAAIDDLKLRGNDLVELLVVEFCDTSNADGMFRKYAAFIVGDQIIPRHQFFSRAWMLKRPDIVNEENSREQMSYLETNPHEPWLRQIFALAAIDYGRIDYSLLGDEPQVWEINTNPTVRKLAVRLTSAFEAIDCGPRSRERIPIRATLERPPLRGTEPARREPLAGSIGSSASEGGS